MTTWVYNDGGRSEAGFKGFAGDCVVRAIAIVTEIPYKAIYDDLRYYLNVWGGGSPRNGVRVDHVRKYLNQLGFRYVPVRGEHVTLHRDELPKGKVIAELPRHVCAVIDGVINDAYDPNEKKHQKLNGYWIKKGK